MMKPREPMEDWEERLHRELTELPDLKAPPTLISGVLHRLPGAAPSAWYQRSWWQWPVGLRVASALCVLALLGVLGWLGGSADGLGLGQRLADWVTVSVAAKDAALDSLGALPGFGGAFWSHHGQMILAAAAALLLACYMTCVAAGTALYRLAWRRI